jgi:hypothetical protein
MFIKSINMVRGVRHRAFCSGRPRRSWPRPFPAQGPCIDAAVTNRSRSHYRGEEVAARKRLVCQPDGKIAKKESQHLPIPSFATTS